MAYDETLAERIRELLAADRGVTERKMFGGLAFLIGGNMAIAASGSGGALVRCDPAETEALIVKTGARRMVMRGRELRGWLQVSARTLRSGDELASWVAVGASFARSLPAK